VTRNSVLGENEGLHSDFCGPLLPTPARTGSPLPRKIFWGARVWLNTLTGPERGMGAGKSRGAHLGRGRHPCSAEIHALLRFFRESVRNVSFF